jgi:hypothetical protein
MYFETQDVEIFMTDFYVTADAKVDTGNGGGILDMNESFGGFVIGDVVTAGSVTGPTYTHPSAGAASWAGVAHDPTKTDVYPMKFPNGGFVTAKMAAVTGDVVMNFKAEFASNSPVNWQGVSKSVSAAGGIYQWEVPATTDTYNNFLLYLDSKDAALVVESVVVTPNN